MKAKKQIISIVVVLLIVLVGCAQKVETIKQEELTPVNVTTVSKGEIKITDTYTGQIEPLKEINIVSKSMGEVKEVYFGVGERVKQGDRLFVLDKKYATNNIKALDSQSKASEVGIDMARSAVHMTQGSQSENLMNQSKAGVDVAKLQFDDAAQKYEDLKVLYAQGAASKQQLDQVSHAYAQSKIIYESSKQSYDLLVGKILKENVNSAENQLNQALVNRNTLQIQLQNARDTLVDLEVTSPIDGIVAVRNVESGEMTGTGLPAFIIVDMDTVCIQINIPEKLINTIQVGQNIDVSVKAVQKELFTGVITRVSPVADKSTMTYPVKIEISNKDNKIKPGMFAEVLFDVEKSSGSIVLPRNILKLEGKEWFAYMIEQDVVHKVPVEIGIDNGVEIEVISGLKEGQKIIVKGREYVKDGEKVSVVAQ